MTQKVTAIPTTVHEATGWIAIKCKKRKLNVTVNDFTYPSPNKAIQTNKIEFNNNFNSEIMQENISKKSCNKKCH